VQAVFFARVLTGVGRIDFVDTSKGTIAIDISLNKSKGAFK